MTKELDLVNAPALAPVRDEPGSDGSIHKAHYGAGKQPWDTTVEHGWGPHAAAFCVIRYLRRDKARAHSLESARWYYDQLIRNVAGEINGPWTAALTTLEDELTQDERKLVRNGESK